MADGAYDMAKEKEKKEKDKKEKADSIAGVRVTKKIIRRRTSAADEQAPEPPHVEEPPKVEEAAPVVMAAPEAAAAVKEAVGEAKPSKGGKKAASKKIGKESLELPLTPPGESAKPEVPSGPIVIEKKAKEEGDDGGKDGKKREVKVFGKEDKREMLFYAKQPFKKAKQSFHDTKKKGSHATHAHAGARPMKKTEITVTKAEKRVVKMVDAISVSELSQKTGIKSSEIIKKLMGLGIMATVNQLIDFDAAALVATDFGFEVEKAEPEEETLLISGAEETADGERLHRAPVVTVMGHVDHGKTSLLDAIRTTNVVSGEAGGITQHIGAYHVHLDKGDVTFLDTPGHAAFTAMRARGAKVTDIVVLVVAANDGVMPQTIEAINHAKAAGVPIIVAINKIDLPDANSAKIRQSLTEYNLVSEEWGGETIFIEISAKKKIKIKELLELILLQAEMLQLKANKAAPARGVIVEAKLDKGRGPVATVLIQDGTLKVGDACIAGAYAGRVRAMVSDWGKRINEAGPSMPVEILGLPGVPLAGDIFSVVKDEATAKQIAAIRLRKVQEADRMKTAKVSLTDLYDKISRGEVRELNVVLKADVQGSIEALREALGKIESDKVTLKVIHTAVGGINDGDIMLAAASGAIIIGFNVRPQSKAAQLAEKEGVDVRLYNIIYNIVDDIKKAMEGLLAPIVTEEALGKVEIREVFKLSRSGVIAGCYVLEGKVTRTSKARLVRDSVVIYEGRIGSLKRFKDDVKEVQGGFECGLAIEGYNDIRAGDIIEVYELKEEAAKL